MSISVAILIKIVLLSTFGCPEADENLKLLLNYGMIGPEVCRNVSVRSKWEILADRIIHSLHYINSSKYH
jgi:hypothetical protein